MSKNASVLAKLFSITISENDAGINLMCLKY